MRPIVVKVPGHWKVDSSRARDWLRDYFVRPTTLPLDPGAGEKAVCLSVNERQVDALARGLGQPRAVALRRLIAAHVAELPYAAVRGLPPANEKIVRIHKTEKSQRSRPCISDGGFVVEKNSFNDSPLSEYGIFNPAWFNPPQVSTPLAAPAKVVPLAKYHPVVRIALCLSPILVLMVLVVLFSNGARPSSGGKALTSPYRPWVPR